jgi:hypothetical protein
VRNNWLVKTVPAGQQWPFASKTAADPFCRAWVQEHPGSELMLFLRKGMRPTTRYRHLDGQALAEELHRRISAGKPSKRSARSAAEQIDIQLQNVLKLTARDAVRARQALVEVWKEGMQAAGLVWTPTGVLLVVDSPRVQRARNSSFSERRKLTQRTIKIRLKPNPKHFPEPEKTEYTYRQFAYAQQLGLIEDPPPRPEPQSLMARVMRPTSGKSKRIPPRRPRR